MLPFLFRGLTPASPRGAVLFAAVVAKAREPHWYVEGAIPDTIDGRFRVLATFTALVEVRLQQAGDEALGTSAALTERFIEAMDSDHRQIGLGDPGLGKTVRKLVGSLTRRVEMWRTAVNGDARWDDAVFGSLYKDAEPRGALRHSSDSLRQFWSGLQAVSPETIAEGQIA